MKPSILELMGRDGAFLEKKKILEILFLLERSFRNYGTKHMNTLVCFFLMKTKARATAQQCG